MAYIMNVELPELTVSQLNRHIRYLVETHVGAICVVGEVSNLSRPVSGHFYFTLKDASSQLRCVFFRDRHTAHSKTLENGQSVRLYGQLSLYEARGDFQLIVEQVHEEGRGDLYLQFELLKQKLAALGLFDAARKKTIPRFSTTIGVIVSPSAAALRDILTTLARRFPVAHIIIYPSEVQGKAAPLQLINAIGHANHEARCQVLLLARGGGSIEDLWAFNDEALAFAIANSSIPIVTGIGHETDFTLADFVADLRAATPTAAAESVTPDAHDLEAFLQHMQSRLISVLQRGVIRPAHRQITQTVSQLQFLIKQKILHCKQQLASLSSTLHALSPLATLDRGYAIVSHQHTLILSSKQISVGDAIDIQLSKGKLVGQVLSVLGD